MQHELTNKIKTWVALNKGIHQALDNFQWLLPHMPLRPTRIADFFPKNSSPEGHHDGSGKSTCTNPFA